MKVNMYFLPTVLNHFDGFCCFFWFAGELEQKRRAQSFLAGQEPKAGKLVSSHNLLQISCRFVFLFLCVFTSLRSFSVLYNGFTISRF